MSTHELSSLFPSQLHPALPVSAQILSTLRGLTAPGRGNDLRPEERAALVGVAALIGCEKVQSKDLSEKSAQKACSVSPAHFRSALSHARRILESIDTPSLRPYSSRRSTRTSTTSPSKPSPSTHNPLDDGEAEEVTPANTGVPSPFNTPKKKFKYSSGIDVSSLVKNTPRSLVKGHEPAQSSPLRHSVTPSKRPLSSPADAGFADVEQGTDVGIGEGENRGGEEDNMRTPTKRVKYSKGVDLEHVDVPAVISSTRKKKEDPRAFFALRPGGGGDAPPGLNLGGDGEGGRRLWNGNIPMEDGLPDVRPPRVRRTGEGGVRKKVKERVRRGWRYPETVWGEDKERQQEEVDKVLKELPIWLEANGKQLVPLQGDVEDMLLGKTGDEQEVA